LENEIPAAIYLVIELEGVRVQ